MATPPDPKRQTSSALLRRAASELRHLAALGAHPKLQLETDALATELIVRATRIEVERAATESLMRITVGYPQAAGPSFRNMALKFIDDPLSEAQHAAAKAG